MKIREQDLAAVGELGYTADEARFLYIVATHSGYFQPRHYIASNGLAWGGRVQRLTEKLESRGHATWREYQGMGGVYHLVSKTIYRRIEKTDLRNRRRHSTEYIRTRLILLDFILENPQYDYFETETDKLAYFCEEQGFPKEILPAKVYSSASGAPPAKRFFVDKFPLFRDFSGGCSSPVATFSYVDPGQVSPVGFAHHLQQYAPLFAAVREFALIYIAGGSANFAQAEECFASVVKQRAKTDAVAAICRFFELRRAWELKRYGQFSSADLENLEHARRLYGSAEIESLYSSWISGEVDDPTLKRALAKRYGSANIVFRTYVVRGTVESRARDGAKSGSGLHPRTSGDTSAPASASEFPQHKEIEGDEG